MALFSLPLISFLILYEVLEKESLPITNEMVHLIIDRHRQSNLSDGFRELTFRRKPNYYSYKSM